MLKITEEIYGIMTKGQFLNYFVITNGDSLTVVDIGMGTADVDRLERELKENAWSLEQVKHILITHAHPDHIGGLAELQKRSNAHTYIHRLDAPVVRGEQGQVFANPDEVGFFTRMMISVMQQVNVIPARVDTELQGDEVLDEILPDLRVVHLPGHSYGHSGFYSPKDNLLIGGDVVINYPWGLGYTIRMPSPDWVAVKESMRKVADMNLNTLCLGHGKNITEDVSGKIKRLLAN